MGIVSRANLVPALASVMAQPLEGTAAGDALHRDSGEGRVYWMKRRFLKLGKSDPQG
jgi:hypothetical protein